jgi:hypothetical protein
MNAALPPAPPPGSARFFALLYAPAGLRDALSRLLAVADEIGAEATRTLEPAVAQARLAWWQLEAERYAAGKPQHPWLKYTQSGSVHCPPIDLIALIEAEAADPSGLQLRRALFIAAAELLGAGPLTPLQRQALGELGAQSWQPPQPAAQARAPPALHGVQARIAPLLVWAALAARTAGKDTPLRGFADNMRAWHIARRASTGRYIQP